MKSTELLSILKNHGSYSVTGDPKTIARVRATAHNVKKQLDRNSFLKTWTEGNKLFIEVTHKTDLEIASEGIEIKERAKPERIVFPAGDYAVGHIVEHISPVPDTAKGHFVVKSLKENKKGVLEATVFGGPDYLASKKKETTRYAEGAWRTFLMENLVRVD